MSSLSLGPLCSEASGFFDVIVLTECARNVRMTSVSSSGSSVRHEAGAWKIFAEKMPEIGGAEVLSRRKLQWRRKEPAKV